MSTNAHGLSRNIPNEVKYAVRKGAGFGCASCGVAIGYYEHIDPQFCDATEHDPDRMTYLCGRCHGKVTRGFVSKETVWDWKRRPWCIEHGRCHESFDVGRREFYLWVGGAKVSRIQDVLTYDDECILRIRGPEDDGAPYRLSAKFHDESGRKALEIVDNEWCAESSAFDIICENGKVGIRTPKGFALKIVCFPPDGIVLEQIDMLYDGLRIESDRQGLSITGPKGGSLSVSGRLLTAVEDGCSLFTFSSQASGLVIGKGVQVAPLNERMPQKALRSYACRRNEPCPCGSGKKYKRCCSPIYNYEF
jgi:hypothetical protein